MATKQSFIQTGSISIWRGYLGLEKSIGGLEDSQSSPRLVLVCFLLQGYRATSRLHSHLLDWYYTFIAQMYPFSTFLKTILEESKIKRDGWTDFKARLSCVYLHFTQWRSCCVGWECRVCEPSVTRAGDLACRFSASLNPCWSFHQVSTFIEVLLMYDFN